MWPSGDPREEVARAAAARLQLAKDDPWSSRSALRGAPLPSALLGSDSSTGSDRSRPRAPLGTPLAPAPAGGVHSAPATARTSVSSDGPASSYTSALSCHSSWEAAALQDAYDPTHQHHHHQHAQPGVPASSGRHGSGKGSGSSSGGDGSSSDSSFRRDHAHRRSTSSTRHNPPPAGAGSRGHGSRNRSSTTSTYQRGYAAQPGSFLHTPTLDLSTSSSSEDDEGTYVTGNSVLYGTDSTYFPSDNSNSSVDIRRMLGTSSAAATGTSVSPAAAAGPLAAGAAGGRLGPGGGSISRQGSAPAHPTPALALSSAAKQKAHPSPGDAVSSKADGGMPVASGAAASGKETSQEGAKVVLHQMQPSHSHPFSSASSSQGGPLGGTLHSINPLAVSTVSSSGDSSSFTTTTPSSTSSNLRGMTIRPAAGRGRGCMDSATSIGQYRKAVAASGSMGSSSGLAKTLSGSLSRVIPLHTTSSSTPGAAEQPPEDAAASPAVTLAVTSPAAPAAVAEGHGGAGGTPSTLASPFSSSSSNVGPFSSSSGPGVPPPSSTTSLGLLPGMCDVMSSGGSLYGGLLGPAFSGDAEGRIAVAAAAPTTPPQPPPVAAAAPAARGGAGGRGAGTPQQATAGTPAADLGVPLTRHSGDPFHAAAASGHLHTLRATSSSSSAIHPHLQQQQQHQVLLEVLQHAAATPAVAEGTSLGVSPGGHPGVTSGHQHTPFSTTTPDALRQATNRHRAAPSPSPRAMSHNLSHLDWEDGSSMGGARGKKQARGGQGRMRRHSIAASVLRPPLITTAPAPPPLLPAVIDSATSCIVSTSTALLGNPGDTSGDEATYLSPSAPSAAAAGGRSMGYPARRNSGTTTIGLLGSAGLAGSAAASRGGVLGSYQTVASSSGASSSRRRHSDMVLPHQARQLSGWWAGYHGNQQHQQGTASATHTSGSTRRRSFLDTTPFMEAAVPAAAAAAAASLLGGSLSRRLSAPEQLVAVEVVPPPGAAAAAPAARVSLSPSPGAGSSSPPVGATLALQPPAAAGVAAEVELQQQVTVLAAAPLHAQPPLPPQQQQQQPQGALSSQEMWVADTLACLRAAAAHRAAADQVDPIQKAEQLLARFPDGHLPPWLITTLRSAAASAAEARRQRLAAAGPQQGLGMPRAASPGHVAVTGSAAAAGSGAHGMAAASGAVSAVPAAGGVIRPHVPTTVAVPISPFAAAAAGTAGAAGLHTPPTAATGEAGAPISPFAAAVAAPTTGGAGGGGGVLAHYAAGRIAATAWPSHQQQHLLHSVGRPWQSPQVQQQQHYHAGALSPVYQGAVQVLPVSIKVAGQPEDFRAASHQLTQLATNALAHHLSPTHHTPGAASVLPATAGGAAPGPVVHQLHSCVVRGCVHLLGALFMAAEPGEGAGGGPQLNNAGTEVEGAPAVAAVAGGAVGQGEAGPVLVQEGGTGLEVEPLPSTAAGETPVAAADAADAAANSSSSIRGRAGGGGGDAAIAPAAGVAAAVQAALLQAGSEGQVTIGPLPAGSIQQPEALQRQVDGGADSAHTTSNSPGSGGVVGAWLYPPVLTVHNREPSEFSGFSSSGRSNSTTHSCRQSVVLVLSGTTLAAATAAAAEAGVHSSLISPRDGAAVEESGQGVRRISHATSTTTASSRGGRSRSSSSSDTGSSVRRATQPSSDSSGGSGSNSRRRMSRSPTGRCSRHRLAAGDTGQLPAAAGGGAGGAGGQGTGAEVEASTGGGQGLRLVVFQASGRVLLDEEDVVLQSNCIRFEVDVAAAAAAPTAADRRQRHQTHQRHHMGDTQQHQQQQHAEEEPGVVFVVLLHGAAVLVPALPLPLLPAASAAELNNFWAAVACHAAASPAVAAAAATGTSITSSNSSSRRLLELEPTVAAESTASEATATAAGLERTQSRQFLQALATAAPSVPITEDSAAMLAHGGMPQGLFAPRTTRGHPLLRRWWQQRWPNDWTSTVFRCLLVDPAALAAATEAHLQRVLPVLVDVAAVLAAAARTARASPPQPDSVAQAGRSAAAAVSVGGRHASQRMLPVSGSAAGHAAAGGEQHSGAAGSSSDGQPPHGASSGIGAGASNQVSSDDSAGMSLRVTRHSSSSGSGSAAGTGSAAVAGGTVSAPGALAAPAADQGRLLVHSVLSQLLPYLAHLGMWGSIAALCTAAGVASPDAVQQARSAAGAASAAADAAEGRRRLVLPQQQLTSPFADASAAGGASRQPRRGSTGGDSAMSGIHSSLERHASVPVQFQEHWQQLRQADHAAWLSRQHSDTLLVVQAVAGRDPADVSGPGAAASAALARSASVPLPEFVDAASAAPGALGATAAAAPAVPRAEAAAVASRGFGRHPDVAPHAQLLSLQHTPSHQPVWAVIDQPWSVSSPTTEPTPVLRSPRTSVSVEATPPVGSGPAAVRAAAASDHHGSSGLTGRQESRWRAESSSRRRRGLSWRSPAYGSSSGPMFTPRSAPASPVAQRFPPAAPSAASGLQVDMRGGSSTTSSTPRPGAGPSTASTGTPRSHLPQQQVRSGVPNGRLSLDSAYELYAGAGGMSGQPRSSVSTSASGMAALAEGSTGGGGVRAAGPQGVSTGGSGGGGGGALTAGAAAAEGGGTLRSGHLSTSRTPAAGVSTGRWWWVQHSPVDAASSVDDWHEVEGMSADTLAGLSGPAAAAGQASGQATSPASSSQLFNSALSAAFGSRSGVQYASSNSTRTTTSSRGHWPDTQGSPVGTEPVTPRSGSYTHTHAATPTSSRRRNSPSTAVTLTTDGSSGSYKSLLSIQLPGGFHVGDLDSAQYSTPLVGPLEGAGEEGEASSAWSPTSAAATHSQPPLLPASPLPPPLAAAAAAAGGGAQAAPVEAPTHGQAAAGTPGRNASISADVAHTSTGISDSSSSHVGSTSTAVAAAVDGVEMDSLAAQAAATSSLAAQLFIGGPMVQPFSGPLTTTAPGRRVVAVSGNTSSSLCRSRGTRGTSSTSWQQDQGRFGQDLGPAAAAAAGTNSTRPAAEGDTAAAAAAPVVVRLTMVNPRLLVPLEDGTGAPRAVQLHDGMDTPAAAPAAPSATRPAEEAGWPAPAQSVVTQLHHLPSLQAGVAQLSTVEESASTPFAAQSQVLLRNSSGSTPLPSPAAATAASPGGGMYRRSSSTATDATEDTQMPPAVWTSVWHNQAPTTAAPAAAPVVQAAGRPAAMAATTSSSSSYGGGVSAASVAAALLGQLPPTTAAAPAGPPAAAAAGTTYTTRWASIPEDVAVSSGVREQMCGVTFDQELTGDLVTPATGWLNTCGSSWGSVSVSSGSEFGVIASAGNSATAVGRAGGGYLCGGMQWQVVPPGGSASGALSQQQASQGSGPGDVSGDTTAAAAAAGGTRASSSASSVPAAQQASLAAAAAAAKQAIAAGGVPTPAVGEPTAQPPAAGGGGPTESSARGSGTGSKAGQPRWWLSLGGFVQQRKKSLLQDSALDSQLGCRSGSFAGVTSGSPSDGEVTLQSSSTSAHHPASSCRTAMMASRGSRHVQLLSDSSNVVPLPADPASSSSCAPGAGVPAVDVTEAKQGSGRASVPMCGVGMGCWGKSSTAATAGGVEEDTGCGSVSSQGAQRMEAAASTARGQQGSSNSSSSSANGGGPVGVLRKLQQVLLRGP